MIKRLYALIILLLFINGCTAQKKIDNNIILEFATWGSASEIRIVKQIISDYEKENPNIKIKLIHTPQNYFKKLHLQFASHTEPDIILINNQNISRYSNYLQTIEKSNYSETFLSGAINALSINDSLKAIPRDISNLVIYYNKTLLTQNNIQIPTKSWTIKDFLDISQKLKEKGIFSLPLEDDLFYAYPFIMSFGENAEYITPDNMYSYKGINFFKDLSHKYHYAPMDYEIGNATGAEFFLGGKCAFYLSGRWMTPKIHEIAKFEWDILPFPSGENDSKVPCDATGWGISKNTKHLKDAVKFANYLSSASSIEKMSATGLIVPARKDIIYTKAFLTQPPDNVNLFIDVANASTPIIYPKNYNIIKDKINNRLKNYRQDKIGQKLTVYSE